MTPVRLALLLLLLALALVAPQLRNGAELVRVRHALTLGPDLALNEDWAPPAYPPGFRREPATPDPYFAEVARRLDLQAQPDDWARTLVISRHLLGSAPRLKGGAIQRDLDTTYRRIVEQGDGYCGDFVRAFTAIANAAGMVVRPWAFSFNGFGGQGHIWVEVWNRQQQAWQLADVFQNYYYTAGDDDRPLSAHELHRAMAGPASGWQLRRLHEGARPGWAVEARARDYLVRGREEWFALWGNNVTEVDRKPAVQWAGRVSRAAEGAAAIATGVQPAIRMLATDDNRAARDGLRGLRWRLGAAGLALAAAALLLAAAAWRRWQGVGMQANGGDGAGAPSADGSEEWPRLCLVGPLPPPSGGMANQCEQLLRLLRAEGAPVELVRTNPPYRPAWAGRVPVLRALVRLLPYLLHVWAAVGRAQVVHLLANSGWAWHLFAAPVLWMARLRGTPVIVNYRGGLAEQFLDRAPRHVHAALRGAALRVTPSAFLMRVFARQGLDAEIIPNIIDLERFAARPWRAPGPAAQVVVARNLEPIYGLPTALQAFALLRRQHPQARLTIAGSGPQEAELRELARTLGVADAVRFPGRIDHAQMPALYADADVALNPSTADNMPNSVLEAFASGVPVVSTDVGGVPDVVDDGVQGLLVPAGDAAAMAAAMHRVLCDDELSKRLVEAGLERARSWGWPRVRTQWLAAYRRAVAAGTGAARPPRPRAVGRAGASSARGH
ncbi:glycosyltransferase [Pseudorhodoferax sp.]|uniref:glycosyltransferase n=1 Tax=Pseudorhodoferax sp. TaxID=1993553 RepID=UPI002DD66DD1|nr:glycosyltransferase [Pseudorhodoferax sp.]